MRKILLALAIALALALAGCNKTMPLRGNLGSVAKLDAFREVERDDLCDAQDKLEPLKKLTSAEEVKYARIVVAGRHAGERLGDIQVIDGKLREVSIFIATPRSAEDLDEDFRGLIKKFIRLANRSSADPELVVKLVAPDQVPMAILREIVEPEVRHCDVELQIVQGTFYDRTAGILISKRPQ